MKKILFLALLSVSCALGAEDSVELNKEFSLPISAVPPKRNLVIKISSDYIPLQPVFLFENSNMLEFVPKGQNGDNWTEIITLNKYIGIKASAHLFIDHLKKAFMKATPNTTIWRDEKSTDQGHPYGSVGFLYTLKNQVEVCRADYYSGPYDCVGVQYTIRPTKDESVAATQAKINRFFTENVSSPLSGN